MKKETNEVTVTAKRKYTRKTKPTILAKKLNVNAKVTKAHPNDAGIDLYAAEDITLWFNKPTKVKTNICIKLPKDTMAFITPRSSLNAKNIVVEIGTIDEGYTGELLVVMKATHYKIKKGDKIAQLVVLPRFTGSFDYVEELPTTSRSTKGFGSSGK